MTALWKNIRCTLALGLGATWGAAQSSIPTLLDEVRPSVVRIEIIITPFGDSIDRAFLDRLKLPDGIKQCFRDRPICTAGTGVIVDDDGDVLTASHVVRESEKVIAVLKNQGSDGTICIGISEPNSESIYGEVSGNVTLIRASVAAVDSAIDVALLHPERSSSMNIPQDTDHHLPQASGRAVKFSTRRPREAEEVFACGFPLGQVALVTTTGTIASAWYRHVPLTAASGSIGYLPKEIDSYQADLRVNPGNSGGPVFSVSDHGVIGIVTEYSGGPGGLAVIIPSIYLVDFLDKQSVHPKDLYSPKSIEPAPR